MKSICTIIFFSFSSILLSQNQFSYDNFEEEFLKYIPVKKEDISDDNFSFIEMAIKNTKKSIKNNDNNFNVAHYWNIATVFFTLKEDKEKIKIAFLKAIESDGVCNYFESFKNISNHFKKHIPELYAFHESECEKKTQNSKNTPFDVKRYTKENSLEIGLVSLMEKISKSDKLYRKESDGDVSQQEVFDKKNQTSIDSIYSIYKTYIGKSLVGEKFDTTMWAVIQHSNIEMMERYLPIIQKAVHEKELGMVPFKMLIDRIFHQKEGCQIYGSQAGVKLADENIRNQISTEYGIE